MKQIIFKMPKRPNPWGECSPLQLKSHIGIKEANISDESKMESVYERTKSLLYQGSKKELSGFISHIDLNYSKEQLQVLPGQMRFDSQGQLCTGTSATFARQIPSPVTMDSNSCDMPFGSSDKSEVFNLPRGQMTLNCMGQLQAIPTTAGSTNQKKIVAFKVCHICNHGNLMRLSKCLACDRDTCIECLLQCSECESFVCKLCCGVNYQDSLERNVCYQCSI